MWQIMFTWIETTYLVECRFSWVVNVPRKRASQERREREKLNRSALIQAALWRVQQRPVEFRPDDNDPVVDAAEAE